MCHFAYHQHPRMLLNYTIIYFWNAILNTISCAVVPQQNICVIDFTQEHFLWHTVSFPHSLVLLFKGHSISKLRIKALHFVSRSIALRLSDDDNKQVLTNKTFAIYLFPMKSNKASRDSQFQSPPRFMAVIMAKLWIAFEFAYFPGVGFGPVSVALVSLSATLWTLSRELKPRSLKVYHLPRSEIS